MTATQTLIVKYRLYTSTKKKLTLKQKQIKRHCHQTNLLKPLQTSNHHCTIHKNPTTMSNTFMRELDLKMQQVKEYGLITHGYYNENIQYPTHVRRSHDGEKVSRTTSIFSRSSSHKKKPHLSNTTILTSSSHENQTKIKQKESTTRQLSYDERQTTLIIPPNKTVNDINPSLNNDRLDIHRKSSSSSANSSPILSSFRPHSIAGLSSSSTITDEQQINSLSHSSQSLVNQSPPTKTLTQRFFSKLFHHPSKS
ncbi:unnamed protein product [Adineta steineri]|uniref:Uncharacterized protein n=1 Tax=Adineta steineri TaxID=433720 RepID=A0A818RSD5_9BILA|nr:unnamed protein product [Adineta steineri]CAF3658497.1 unnamed protein product [Adineta steineri]